MSISQRHIVTTLLSALLIFTGCEKRRLKQPTDIVTIVDIERNSTNLPYLTFSDGYIRLASLSLAGNRERGEDIDFSREWETGLVVQFDPSSRPPELNFNIPQGVYTMLDLNFDTFDDNGDPTVLVNGTYINTQGQSIPVRFIFLDAEYFSIVAEADIGNGSIVLDKDVLSEMRVILDPIHWFQTITINQWENASTVSIDGAQTILIDENTNTTLFEIVVERLDESCEVTL